MTQLNTATATDQLLEAMAALENHTNGGLAGLQAGLPPAIAIADEAQMPHLADVWRRVSDLAATIAVDIAFKED